MSINHARNAMIELGIAKGAKWILPWDENCFLTSKAWDMIAHDLFTPDAVDDDAIKYFVVWMDRLKVENDVVLDPAYVPNAWEEPQIIFRRDATERFDEALRYGRRDKAALLIRLNVPGVWFEWGWSAWERLRTFDNPSSDGSRRSTDNRPKVPSTGFVIRLYSGNPVYEDQAFGFHREMARAEAIARQLESLEDQVMRDVLQFHPTNLVVYSKHKLLRAKQLFQTQVDTSPLDPPDNDRAIVVDVLKQADRAMRLVAMPTASFVRAKATPQDVSVAFESMVYNLTALVFGSFISNNEDYAHHALQLLHQWFIRQPDGTLPHPAKLVRSGQLMTMRTLPLFLDTVKLFHDSHLDAYTSGVLLHVRTWLRKYYDDLALDKAYRPNVASRWFRSASRRGMHYDMQMASLAAYFDEPAVYRYHADTVQSRMLSDGVSIPTMRDWVHMATIAQSAGIDVWEFHDHRLCANVAMRIPCCGNSSTYECTAATTADVMFANGWDMLPLVLSKCVQCSALATVQLEQLDDVVSLHVARAWHVPPFLHLWQT
ncbi:hypothetical protein, variant [Aphanomyces invadans]|nr:hypothetical protein, variant [Aphanomyces invadans]ETV91998.1 hypothetical protein, variant [Aphanomyces invadans]|eukprot:XP_008879422.1 hypothetical protein, variant [Aphanomyces invadans]